MTRKTIKKSAAILAMTSLVFFSCKNQGNSTTENKVEQQPKQEFVDEHNAKNSLDWAGIYEGTLPCASCPGINTTLKLNADLTFELTEVYLDEEQNNFVEKGSFTWDKKGTNITLNIPDRNPQYKCIEGSVIALDTEGKVIEGELSKFYILSKKE
ncbi:copper resistance protein NlpE [uncultured Tenacibaculum sp.]|uniref:copper resistance protein NlpE n=1 Tax=uncultured Tenacibaculum sp. TaxID=174713 RepID=UPI0026192844|nr:copper resistance protein NlpE [uncultured Tenacibaculum sp.]